MNLKTLHLQVRQKRKKLSLSQEDIAQKIGVCRVTIVNFEKGKTMLKYDKQIMLNKLVGIK